VVVVLGLALTTAVALTLFYHARSEWDAAFRARTNLWVQSLDNELSSAKQWNDGTARFIANSQTVTREEFRRFTSPLLQQDPAISDMAWHPRVTPSDRTAYEAAHGPILEQADDGTQRADAREAWYPRLYVEPDLSDAGVSPTAPGDVRQAALQSAVNGRSAALSAPHAIDGTSNTPGVTLFEPVFSGQSIRGVVSTDLRLPPLFSVFDSHSRLVSAKVVDVTRPDRPQPLYDNDVAATGDSVSSSTLGIGGRRWRVELSPAPGAGPQLLTTLVVTLVGLLATVLAALQIVAQNRRTQSVERQVAAGTDALLEANTNLRRHAEERETTLRALRESEARYRLLAENANDIISRHRQGGEITYVSPAVRTLLGYDPADMEGHNAYEFFHPEDRDDIERRSRELLAARQSFTALYRVRHRDGHYLWVETVHRVLSGDDGVEVLCVSRDISERMEAEQALRESEQMFRAVFELASVGMAFITPTGARFVRVNHRLADMLGYSTSEMEELTIADITHPVDQQISPSEFQQVLAGNKESFMVEKRYLHKKGHTVWIQANTTLIRHTDGEPRYFVSQIVDISDRKHAEDRLAQLSHQQQLILNAAGEGIYGVDLDGTMVFANEAAGEILGYPAEGLVGSRLHEHMHHTDADGTSHQWEDCRIYHSIRDRETHYVDGEVFRHRDGHRVDVQYVSSPIIENGRATGAVVVFSELGPPEDEATRREA